MPWPHASPTQRVLLDVPDPKCEREAITNAREYLMLNLLAHKDHKPTGQRLKIPRPIGQMAPQLTALLRPPREVE